jgi:putative glutamine amidotransferase
VEPRVAFTIGFKKKAEPYLARLRDMGLAAACFDKWDMPESLDGFAALMLGGGRDVNPRLYGETRLDRTQEPDPERDEKERALLAEALRRDLPVFAICRGLQLVNVHLGGTLHQHIENHSEVEHEVVLEEDSLVARAAAAKRYSIQSRHHQAIKDLAPGLRATARAGDGIVEAVELDGPRFLLAVQWHPEDGAPASVHDANLFSSFAKAVR